jgi:NADH-quinone oxidoreductase subunit E
MKGTFAHNPDELARAVNLMAHPAASVMALSAVGFGLASHAMGSWMGAMSAAAEVSQRFWEPLLGGGSASASVPEPKARAGADAAPSAQKAERFAKAPAAAQPGRKAATIVALRRPAKEASFAKEPVAAVTSPPAAAAAPSAPAKVEKPARPDDLKAISGIGPKLAQVLNGLGIWTYAQIAAWTETDVAWVDDFLGSKGRVGRDGWIAQAAMLAETPKTGAGAEDQV